MALRIGLDARIIDNSRKTGLGVYADELINNMTLLNQDNRYILYFTSLRRNAHSMPGPFRDNVAKAVIPLPYLDNGVVTNLLNRVFLPRYLRRNRIDVYHSLYSLDFPRSSRTKKVLTIHGLGYLYMDHEFLTISRTKYRQQHQQALDETDACIAVSHHTKNDILSLFDVDPNKVHVVHLGVSDRFRPLDDVTLIEDFKQRYNLPTQFILAVGAGKRKNTHGLLQAFSLLKKNSTLEHKLVIVSRLGKWTEHIPGLIKELRLSENVFLRDYFHHNDIPLLYNAAELFVFPSFFEGFGMPPLEAMKCGVPVIVSNRTTLPEVVGTAGITVDPQDQDVLAEAIERVLTNSELYESLRQEGLKRAAEFSWAKTAQETLDVYRQVTA